MPTYNFVRASFYQDSVALMRLSAELESVPGVTRASVMMGTPANRELLRDAGLLATDGEAAGPADLVIAVIAADRAAADRVRDAAERALTSRQRAAPMASGVAAPRTLASALKALPDATLALVSVPGAYAGAEAMKALRAGLHVMLFSDNVPVATEIELKQLARARGLFLMGPDCGTAILHGVPLGFANAVAPGRIGIAAASGTGLQEVSSLITNGGEGISHAIGVGGRDLSDEVGGLMMAQALDALAADPATEVLCVIGKPPGPVTARALAEHVGRLGKPCVAQFMGETAEVPGATWHRAATLEDAARAVVALARGEKPPEPRATEDAAELDALAATAARGMATTQRFVRGVYSGGTLAYEAIGILSGALANVDRAVTGGGTGHRVTDLGEDRFTVGRPHPMIDGTVRREWLEREAADPTTAVLLLDVVLGHGAHLDPAGELVPALTRAQAAVEAAGRRLAVVASVCGTDSDPQGRGAQIATLRAAGVHVMRSNAQAARLAARIGTLREKAR